MAPPDTAPVPTSQQVVEYLQNLRALANRPEGTGQLNTYLGQTGMSMRPVTLNPRDWPGMGAGKTKQKAQPLNPSGGAVGQIDTARQGIKDAADRVEQLFEEFDKQIARATADKWKGQAAQAAADAISGYVRDSYSMVEAGYAAAAQFEALYNSMTATFHNLPDRPLLHSTNVVRNVVEFWHWPDTTTAQSRADTAANGKAEQVMNSIYYGNDPGQNVSNAGITAVAASLPIFPAPSSPVVSTDTGYTGPSYSGAGSGAAGSGLAGGMDPRDGSTNPNGTGSGGNADGAGNQVGGGQHPGSGLGSNAGSHQGDVASPVAGGGDPVQAASYDPGAGGGGGADGGLGGGDGDDSPLGSPSLDGNSATGSASRGPGAGAAGRSGMGMPGMGMPGARGGKNGDKDHKTADYLRGNHLQEIFETVDGRKVGPPVLGVWDTDESESPERDDA